MTSIKKIDVFIGNNNVSFEVKKLFLWLNAKNSIQMSFESIFIPYKGGEMFLLKKHNKPTISYALNQNEYFFPFPYVTTKSCIRLV